MTLKDYLNNQKEICRVDDYPDKRESKNVVESSRILCKHCLRTLENGKRCIGKCVADNDY